MYKTALHMRIPKKKLSLKPNKGVVGCLAGLYDGFLVKFSLPVSLSTGGPDLFSFSVSG